MKRNIFIVQRASFGFVNGHTILGIILSLHVFFSNILNSQTNIYVCDIGHFEQGPWRILKYDENGENGSVFIQEKLGWPQEMVFLEDKNELLISNFTTSNIVRFNATTGKYISTFANVPGSPTRMKIGKDSLLYVITWLGSGKVKRYTLDGTFVGDFTKTGVDSSIGLDWDTDGNLYVSSFYGKFIEKFNPSGESLGKIITSNHLIGPTNIEFDDEDNLIVLDFDGGAIKKFHKNGQHIKTLFMNTPQCEGLTRMENGQYLVGIGGTGAVRLYDTDFSYIKEIIPSGSGGLVRPNAVTVHTTNTSSTIDHHTSEYFIKPTIGCHFTLASVINGENIQQIHVYTMGGALVFSEKNPSEFDVSELKNGWYMIQATTTTGKKYQNKIMIVQN
ncbi:MAG: T9SS type A sorting domain-containing protein [Saprospiraceae bacterium]